MAKPLRALIIEDNERDAALLLRELRSGGYDLQFERVDTPEAMSVAIDDKPWDVALSDYAMPRFSAPAALAMIKERRLDLPFIIVSGTIGEDIAVAALRAGAHDFIAKGMLARLIPAIERELRECAVRAERKAISEQLMIADRMASVGTLAAGVAHEINNPLAVVIANLEFVSQSFSGLADTPHLAKLREPLRDAQEAAERVRRIVRDLKALSRSGEDERLEPVDVHSVLESSARMASNEIRHRARLVKDYGDVPQAQANEARLGQVFLNLLINAAQAIPEGRADANEIAIKTRRDAAGNVVVEIRDTGSGIPTEVLPRIFDAFFTTKPVGVGTGLGLAICRRIVVSLGGRISVESPPGKGSLFRITLPPAQGPESAIAAGQPATAAAADRHGRILVIDDEPAVCTMIQRILASHHDVVAVTRAREALRLFGDGEVFDAILCDMMMPDMTGMDLHAELSRLGSDHVGRIIFVTGGAFTQNARDFLDRVANPRIEKPFTAASLRGAVRDVLA